MSSNRFRAALMGAPLSGKGTISKLIVDKFQLFHISPGDILRRHIKNNTQFGKKAKAYVDKGSLVPDDMVIACTMQEVLQLHGKNWLLDGFPRTLQQAEHLSNVVEMDAVINLDVPHEVIIDRAKNRWIHIPSGRVYNKDFRPPQVEGKDDVTGEDLSQRYDDQPHVVSKRLQAYDELKKPILEYYRQLNLLTSFKGNTTAEIWPQIEQFLKEKTKAKLAESI